MANNRSALKRIRQNEKRRLHNKYYAKMTRSAIKKLRNEPDKEAATKKLPEIISMIDRLAKRRIIHKNKASNLKSKLTLQVNKL
jgi:small subunit ribosomal protein S20